MSSSPPDDPVRSRLRLSGGKVVSHGVPYTLATDGTRIVAFLGSAFVSRPR